MRWMDMRWMRRYIRYRLLSRGAFALLLLISLHAWLFTPLTALAAPAFAPALPADASCARLAHADPTATNGSNWGKTLLPGLGAKGGWFGVPVCANSINLVAPGGANVSCDRVPTNFAKTGCAPGAATSDGYGWTFQCVELVARFAAWAFGAPPGAWRGDAPYLWLSGRHPASFEAFANGGTRAPERGDILVWGSLDKQGRPWPAGPAGGHVAVVAAVSGGKITFVEENMLGRRGNIPEETTTLTERAGHWTIGPTYATNGGRALYGWLHSTHNNGKFTKSGAITSTNASPTPPAPIPSLTQGVVVTQSGALAELVWSDTHTPNHPADSGQSSATDGAAPYTMVESLGAPPGATLTPNQRPAVVTLPTGDRYIFARGQDGQLYAAYTSPDAPGALWQSLGAPTDAPLMSGATALWDGTNLIVGALGSDGAFWLLAGPAGMLKGWVSLGLPANTTFQGTPALIRAPQSPASSTSGEADSAGSVSWIALGLGNDGALYEADGRAAGAAPASTQRPPQAVGWGGWTPVTISGAASLTGELLALPETQAATASQPESAAPAINAVDALATDTTGRLWLLHRATMAKPWQTRAISLPGASAALLSATLTSGASDGSPALQVYLSTPQSSASQPEGLDILAGSLPLTKQSARSAHWKSLGVTPALAPGASVALSLGPSRSAIITAQSAQVTLTGDQAALEALAPGAKATPAPRVKAASPPAGGAGSVALGPIAPPLSFSDAFDEGALDPGWVVSGAPSTGAQVAQVAQGALTLSAPGSSGRVEVTQGAPAGDFAVTARITPGAAWGAGEQTTGKIEPQAGILLALDDWNTLALSVRADGTVALCPVADGQAQPCDTMAASATVSANQGLYLRISQSGVNLTGSVSADGVSWTPVGVWSPGWLASAEAAPAGANTPSVALTNSTNTIVPLAFTSLGLFVETGSPRQAPGQQTQASRGTSVSARFSDLTVTAGAQASR